MLVRASVILAVVVVVSRAAPQSHQAYHRQASPTFSSHPFNTNSFHPDSTNSQTGQASQVSTGPQQYYHSRITPGASTGSIGHPGTGVHQGRGHYGPVFGHGGLGHSPQPFSVSHLTSPGLHPHLTSGDNFHSYPNNIAYSHNKPFLQNYNHFSSPFDQHLTQGLGLLPQHGGHLLNQGGTGIPHHGSPFVNSHLGGTGIPHHESPLVNSHFGHHGGTGIPHHGSPIVNSHFSHPISPQVHQSLHYPQSHLFKRSITDEDGLMMVLEDAPMMTTVRYEGEPQVIVVQPVQDSDERVEPSDSAEVEEIPVVIIRTSEDGEVTGKEEMASAVIIKRSVGDGSSDTEEIIVMLDDDDDEKDDDDDDSNDDENDDSRRTPRMSLYGPPTVHSSYHPSSYRQPTYGSVGSLYQHLNYRTINRRLHKYGKRGRSGRKYYDY